MRSENRFEQYDLNLRLPSPLVARQDRYTLRERIAADGSVLLPLDVEEVKKLAARIVELKYEAVAIGFGMMAQSIAVPQLLEMPAATGFGLGQTILQAGLWMAPMGLPCAIGGSNH